MFLQSEIAEPPPLQQVEKTREHETNEIRQRRKQLLYSFQCLAVLVCLNICIVFQAHNRVVKLGWLLLAMSWGINIEFAIYSVCFSSAFFVGTGFFQNPFFTIKHLHIPLFLLTLILLFQGKLYSQMKETFALWKVMLWWVAIVAVSLIAGMFGEGLASVIKKSSNIALLAFVPVLLVSTIRRLETLLDALLFFQIGVCLRVTLAALTQIGIFYYFPKENLLFNNQIGFLTASAIFLYLPFLLSPRNPVNIPTVFLWLLIVPLFGGLAISLSRTAWFTFVVGYSLFAVLLVWMKRRGCLAFSTERPGSFLLEVMFYFVVISLLVGSTSNYVVRMRFLNLFQLLDVSYWLFTLHDSTNFGFLGIHRLSQLFALKDILLHNWLLGSGFTWKVIDFHSTYLAILGGTGVIGFVMFLRFWLQWTKSIFSACDREDDGMNAFRIGTLVAAVVWWIYGIMEMFLLRYHIWVMLGVGIILSCRRWPLTLVKSDET